MIKAVVFNGFIKNCISTASKKVQEKRTAALFNATAPFSFVKIFESVNKTNQRLLTSGRDLTSHHFLKADTHSTGSC